MKAKKPLIFQFGCMVMLLSCACTSIAAEAENAQLVLPAAPLVAFLKFHKVAGATVATLLRNACPTPLPPFYWSYERCPGAPHGHG